MAFSLCLIMPCLTSQSSQSVLPGSPVVHTPPVPARSSTSPTALKLPLKCGVIGSNNASTDQGDTTAEMSSEYLQSGKEVYRRLDHDDDIVPLPRSLWRGHPTMVDGEWQSPRLPRQMQSTPYQSANSLASGPWLAPPSMSTTVAFSLPTWRPRNFLLSAD